jgi:hypothetical protein
MYLFFFFLLKPQEVNAILNFVETVFFILLIFSLDKIVVALYSCLYGTSRLNYRKYFFVSMMSIC